MAVPLIGEEHSILGLESLTGTCQLKRLMIKVKASLAAMARRMGITRVDINRFVGRLVIGLVLADTVYAGVTKGKTNTFGLQGGTWAVVATIAVSPQSRPWFTQRHEYSGKDHLRFSRKRSKPSTKIIHLEIILTALVLLLLVILFTGGGRPQTRDDGSLQIRSNRWHLPYIPHALDTSHNKHNLAQSGSVAEPAATPVAK